MRPVPQLLLSVLIQLDLITETLFLPGVDPGITVIGPAAHQHHGSQQQGHRGEKSQARRSIHLAIPLAIETAIQLFAEFRVFQHGQQRVFRPAIFTGLEEPCIGRFVAAGEHDGQRQRTGRRGQGAPVHRLSP